nr:MAG TPA: YrhC-like protein [Caudoviricetes sp.]DAS43371.1 MAG TPA: YrhC-like protein [Caudoviricetes sp.]
MLFLFLCLFLRRVVFILLSYFNGEIYIDYKRLAFVVLSVGRS